MLIEDLDYGAWCWCYFWHIRCWCLIIMTFGFWWRCTIFMIVHLCYARIVGWLVDEWMCYIYLLLYVYNVMPHIQRITSHIIFFYILHFIWDFDNYYNLCSLSVQACPGVGFPIKKTNITHKASCPLMDPAEKSWTYS